MSKEATLYFDPATHTWDDLHSGYVTEKVCGRALAVAYLRPEMRVAEIGAGAGLMANQLAELVREVNVLSSSAARITIAQNNLSQFNNIVFQEVEEKNLPLQNANMDAVFANMHLHHCIDPQAAINQLMGILKPGGRLVITDLNTHKPIREQDKTDQWPGFEKSEIRKWLKNADLVNIIIEDCEILAQSMVFIATGTRRLSMREAVKENYGTIAETGDSCCQGKKDYDMEIIDIRSGSSCCSGSSGSASCCSNDVYFPNQGVEFTTDYTTAEKAIVPEESEQISLGCGNPTAMANLKAGEVVLDIGSGGGIDSFLAANHVGFTGKVIGVDMTPAMLERATAAATKAGITNVEFREGQAESLPVENESIDVILSNCVINLCEDKGLVFLEAFRVLKPGGRLEVSDMVTDKALPLEARSNHGEWSGCISGALPEREYLDLIAQAGFTQIKSNRSNSAGAMNEVYVYSTQVSARKPMDGEKSQKELIPHQSIEPDKCGPNCCCGS